MYPVRSQEGKKVAPGSNIIWKQAYILNYSYSAMLDRRTYKFCDRQLIYGEIKPYRLEQSPKVWFGGAIWNQRDSGRQ